MYTHISRGRGRAVGRFALKVAFHEVLSKRQIWTGPREANTEAKNVIMVDD
jgi:hypothetical protein